MRRALATALVLPALACSKGGALEGLTPQPVVQQQTFSAVEGSLKRVAVISFSVRGDLARSAEEETTPQEVADLVTTFFAEALVGKGVRIVPPSDVAQAFEALGRALPRRDPRLAAEVVREEFGATSVVLGDVYRWRERVGEAFGADRPASVGFEVSLFEVAAGRRIWRGRFDHTQRTISGNVLAAARYPGGGSRWLTVAELARWGARNSATDLVAGQWRASN